MWVAIGKVELPRETVSVRDWAKGPVALLDPCALTRWPNVTTGGVQMAHVATRHIGNHPSHGKLRREFIRQALIDPPAPAPLLGGRPPQPAHVRGVLLKTRQVEPMHAPLLLKDLGTTLSGAAAPYSFAAT